LQRGELLYFSISSNATLKKEEDGGDVPIGMDMVVYVH
jgi:hypothetical protein